MQDSASVAEKAPWYLGRGAVRITYATRLEQSEIVERLRYYAGTPFSGGRQYQGRTVVASTNKKGFVVVFRDGSMMTSAQRMAGCQWKPADRGSAFQVTTLPSKMTRSANAFMYLMAIVTAGVLVVLLWLGVSMLLTMTTAILVSGALAGVMMFVIPRSEDTEERELLAQFFRDTLEAVEVRPGAGTGL